MTTIIIKHVDNVQDLLNAISAVTQVFSDPARFDSGEEVFSKWDGEPCGCDDCVDRIETEQGSAIAAPLVPYLSCPGRGTHLRLIDCWACWSDVYRGAALETDVLAPQAWDVAIAALSAGATLAGVHRANADPNDQPGPAAYVCDTPNGLLLVEADENLLFFRALRLLRAARTVADLREVDERLGLGMWESWYDMHPIDPTDEDIESYDRWADDTERVDHWRDHIATAGFQFEFTHDDMPRPYDQWLPEHVADTMSAWMANEYLVNKNYTDPARTLLRQHGIRLVNEPALLDALG